LLASVRAFSAYFTLASADLVDFSALTLEAVAASKAYLEASSLASSDEMRALAVARASAVHQRGKKSQAKKQRKAYKTRKYRKRNLPLEALAAFRYLTQSLPKATNFFIKFCPENRT
jgi:23S rRNA maturation mini-RNase III